MYSGNVSNSLSYFIVTKFILFSEFKSLKEFICDMDSDTGDAYHMPSNRERSL